MIRHPDSLMAAVMMSTWWHCSYTEDMRKNNSWSPFPSILHPSSHDWLHQQNQNQPNQCFIKLYCKMCLHNAVEVSFLTTYIEKFWTLVCGQFSILTLHGTEKKKIGCDWIFQTVKWKEWGEKRQIKIKSPLVCTKCDTASEGSIQTVGELCV